MLLTLKNIGKIKEARVELNGITVITGANDTGKSTVGRTLFCIFNSFYKINEQIQKERRNAVRKALDGFIVGLDIEEITDNILEKAECYNENPKLLQKYIIGFFLPNYKAVEDYVTEIPFEYITKKVHQIISLSDENIFKTVLSQKLNSEFNGQINNIYSSNDSGIVKLNIKGNNIEVTIVDNEVKDISKRLSLSTKVIYIDGSFVLDNIYSSPIIHTRSDNYNKYILHLQTELMSTKENLGVGDAISKIILSNKIDNICSKINTICSGQMIKTTSFKLGYQNINSYEVLDIKNISSGLKIFIIIKTLLLNGSIRDNGIIILDKPEIHLHPEWQILLAQIIVLLQKEFNMHILLNTYSPYFLRAIQVYSGRCEIADKSKYYLAESIDNKAILKDVTTSIDEVYDKFAKPFESLETERYCY